MLADLWLNRNLTIGIWSFTVVLLFYRGFIYSPAEPVRVEVKSDTFTSKLPLFSNLALHDEQCASAFPGLFLELERMVSRRNGTKISIDDVNDVDAQGYGANRLIIMENKLYVVSSPDGPYSRPLATMNSLVQALTTSPVLLPNIEFVWATDDVTDANKHVWAFTYDETDAHSNVWLMPDFGQWSWPETKVGAFHEVQRNAQNTNSKYLSSPSPSSGAGADTDASTDAAKDYTMTTKTQKLLWRGAVMDKPERQSLVNETAEQSWADVQPLDWSSSTGLASHLLSMSDHCHYAYLAHAEGRSYSGRLKYLLLCQSVVVAHHLKYRQHFSPMLLSEGPEKNYVEVQDDFSDLHETMEWLLRHPAEADGIATRGREMAEKYLSEAAIACYWRRLVTSWAEVTDFKPTRNGVPWESFSLTRSLHWEAH